MTSRGRRRQTWVRQSIPRGRRRNRHSRATDERSSSPRTVQAPLASTYTYQREQRAATDKRRGASNGAPLSIPQSSLLQVVLELAAPRRVTQLAQRLRLDLPDALACDVELAPHLFERPGAPVFETETQLQHAALAAGEPFEDRLDLLLEELVPS